MRPSLKWPLIIAAVFVVARVVVEQSGAPGPANAISLVALYLIVFPLYFSVQIARSSSPHPYRDQLRVTAIYAALARAMVIPAYWLAYLFQWQPSRFAVGQGGVVGPQVGPLSAILITPLVAGVAWVIGSIVIGGGLGSAVIAVRRLMRPR
ncbi:MAG TPA: hypothetical protein VFY29_05880 [Terriglobia bacterium]|nr:hypothetical protein [Terriglobia bacterium]